MLGDSALLMSGGYVPSGATATSCIIRIRHEEDEDEDDDGKNSPLVVEPGPDLPEPLVDHCMVDVSWVGSLERLFAVAGSYHDFKAIFLSFT